MSTDPKDNHLDNSKDPVCAFIEGKIRERIRTDLADYKYGMHEFTILESLHSGNVEYKGFLMRMEVRDGEVYCDNINDYGPKLAIRPWIKPRKAVLLRLVKQSIKYMRRKHNKVLGNMVFYISASDSYPYDFPNLPIFCESKPENRRGILIPDNTFLVHPPDNTGKEDPGVERIDWDVTKKQCRDFCNTRGPCTQVKKDSENANNSTSDNPCINKLFFRGGNTTATRGNIRGYLANLKPSSELPLQIEIPGAGEGMFISKVEPIWSFCRFKYLLNLPGGQPWSYRKKFLFLLKSLTIDVTLIQEFTKGNPNGTYINFFDNIFEPGKDYIQLQYNWTPVVGKNVKVQDHEFKKLETDLKSIYKYYEDNPDEYNSMVERCTRKARLITMPLIYRTIYSQLTHYRECVVHDAGPLNLKQLREYIKEHRA